MDDFTKLLQLRSTKSFFKHRPFNLFANRYFSTYLPLTQFQSLHEKYIEYLLTFDIFGILGIRELKNLNLSALTNHIEFKITNIDSILEQLYKELDVSNNRVSTLINYRRSLEELTPVVYEWINTLVNQLIEYEFDGLNSKSILRSTILSSKVIPKILYSQEILDEYSTFSLLSYASSINLEKALHLSNISGFNFKESFAKQSNLDFQNLREVLGNVINGQLIENIDEFVDTQGVISKIISLIEDLQNKELNKYIKVIATALKKKNLDNLVEIINYTGEFVYRNFNKIIKDNKLHFLNTIEIYKLLYSRNPISASDFLLFIELVTLLDNIGIYFYIDETYEFRYTLHKGILSLYCFGLTTS